MSQIMLPKVIGNTCTIQYNHCLLRDVSLTSLTCSCRHTEITTASVNGSTRKQKRLRSKQQCCYCGCMYVSVHSSVRPLVCVDACGSTIKTSNNITKKFLLYKPITKLLHSYANTMGHKHLAGGIEMKLSYVRQLGI